MNNVPIMRQPLTRETKVGLLQMALSSAVANGLRIERTGLGADGTAVTLVRGKPVNHVLHVILCFLTCGLWLFVWPFVAWFGGEKRYWLEISDLGTPSWRKL